MDPKYLDHMYHRSRIDAQITGYIGFVTLVALLALTLGDRFTLLLPGTDWFSPVRFIWVEAEQGWIPEETLVSLNNFPPASNHGPVVSREVYPQVVCIVIMVGALTVAFFINQCAKRQTRLMNEVFGNTPNSAYQRPWEEIRVTFWALNAALVFILFLFFFMQ